MTQQLTAGSLDVALSVGITDPMHAADKGAQVALIRIIGQSAPYVLIGKPGLKTIADLKGKTISVGQVNDITTVYFERMMAANGLKKGEYDMIAAGVSAARFAALKAGVADAALVLPPLNFQANRAGFPTLGFAADYVKDLPFTGMAVFKPWAATARRAGATHPCGDRQEHGLVRRPRASRRGDRHSGQERPFEPRRCRGKLRFHSQDRLLRAEQPELPGRNLKT